MEPVKYYYKVPKDIQNREFEEVRRDAKHLFVLFIRTENKSNGYYYFESNNTNLLLFAYIIRENLPPSIVWKE